MIPALIGISFGCILMYGLFKSGMLHERSGLAVLVGAIAFFYPVFAAQTGSVADTILQGVIFAGFGILALIGFKRGAHILAGALIAHGIFDLGLHVIGGPGPAWWPLFCAGIDIAAGVILIRLIQTQKVPQ